MNDVTQALKQIEAGDPNAATRLMPLVYEWEHKGWEHKGTQLISLVGWVTTSFLGAGSCSQAFSKDSFECFKVLRFFKQRQPRDCAIRPLWSLKLAERSIASPAVYTSG